MPLGRLFSSLLRLISKDISQLRITGPLWGESPSQRTSNEESVSMSWRRQAKVILQYDEPRAQGAAGFGEKFLRNNIVPHDSIFINAEWMCNWVYPVVETLNNFSLSYNLAKSRSRAFGDESYRIAHKCARCLSNFRTNVQWSTYMCVRIYVYALLCVRARCVFFVCVWK